MHMKAHQPYFSRQHMDFSVLEHIDQSAICIPILLLIRNILYFHTFESVMVRNIFFGDSLPTRLEEHECTWKFVERTL